MKLGNSKSLEWRTPIELFNKLDAVHHFELDAASSDDNHLCPIYHTLANDGLSQPWAPLSTFCNPPYFQIGKWIDKAIEESKGGSTICLLLPAGTDTKWFAKCVKLADSIIFLTGRLKFSEAGSATSPSILVIFNANKTGPVMRVWDWKNESY